MPNPQPFQDGRDARGFRQIQLTATATSTVVLLTIVGAFKRRVIQITGSGTDCVRLRYSKDGGTIYQTLASQTAAALIQYSPPYEIWAEAGDIFALETSTSAPQTLLVLVEETPLSKYGD